ncbi:alpha/beta hydrolase [Bacteroidota bacterium]
MNEKILRLMVIISFTAYCHNLFAQESLIKVPVEYIYDSTKMIDLKAYVFSPSEKREVNPAIVIFHGGGWDIGEASWAFGLAEKYAQKGMVAIAAQYRLSDQETTSPIDAMEDARNIILWMRDNAKELGIDKDKIAAYGWSAGAHLAASTAVFKTIDTQNNKNSVPNALILVSPGLSLNKDNWFKKLIGEDKNPNDYSPAEHLKENMPPSIIVVGIDDTVTPVYQSKLFHENMLKYGNESYLHMYEGVGHLFTPSDQPDNAYPNPYEEIQGKAYHEIDLFLKKLGYIR